MNSGTVAVVVVAVAAVAAAVGNSSLMMIAGKHSVVEPGKIAGNQRLRHWGEGMSGR